MNSSKQTNVKFVDFQCPYCGASLSFPEERRSTAQECPYCSETVIVSTVDSEKGGRLPLPIKTPRLNIRPLRTEDLPDWLEFIKDEDSYKYLSNYEPNDEEAISWLEESFRLRLTHPNGRLPLGIELPSKSKVIGHLSFYLCDSQEHRQGSFMIMMHPDYRRQGYGTEALIGLIDFGFTGIALHDIRVSIFSQNRAGRRMVEKAGMKLEGELTENIYIKEEWMNTAYYGILSTWWHQVSSKT